MPSQRWPREDPILRELEEGAQHQAVDLGHVEVPLGPPPSFIQIAVDVLVAAGLVLGLVLLGMLGHHWHGGAS